MDERWCLWDLDSFQHYVCNAMLPPGQIRVLEWFARAMYLRAYSTVKR
jgi:hypothetical protein